MAVYAARIARTDANPNSRMVEGSEKLKDKFRSAMQKEFSGFRDRAPLTQIDKEQALREGVTRHVTGYRHKRPTPDNPEGPTKVRINIDGRFEIRAGKFPNPDLLFSPAMDEELFRLMMAEKAYYRLATSSADVTQCFLYNSMDDAEHPRIINIHLIEYECGIEGGAYFRVGAASYGCADASRMWYDRVRAQKRDEGQQKSQYNPVRFTQRIGPGSVTVTGVATDDFLTNSTTDAGARAAVAASNAAMDSKWEMTHQDEPRDFIAVNIDVAAGGAVRLTQPDIMKKIEQHFFPDGDHPTRLVPLPPDYDQKQVSCGTDA
jgi:hypothetical protein